MAKDDIQALRCEVNAIASRSLLIHIPHGNRDHSLGCAESVISETFFKTEVDVALALGVFAKFAFSRGFF